MKDTIIAMAMQSLENAISNAEIALHTILAPYGDKGITFNYQPYDTFWVMGEVSPNTFKRIERVCSHPREGLCMIVEGETEWRPLDTTDYSLLFHKIWNVVGRDE